MEYFVGLLELAARAGERQLGGGALVDGTMRSSSCRIVR